MIKAIVFYDETGKVIKGFRVSGHAGYAECGNDIVCSAVSMLTINTCNSIERLTEDRFAYQEDEVNGFIELEMQDITEKSQLLLSSFVLGLHSVEEAYGHRYIKITNESNP